MKAFGNGVSPLAAGSLTAMGQRWKQKATSEDSKQGKQDVIEYVLGS